jgi:glycosyltransferase involved in cell wall biosynthesis
MNRRQSVIMPVRNGATLVGRAIASALPQLAQDDEVVVVDNGSADDTISAVKASADPRVRLVEEKRLGPAAARNTGLAVATGQLISFLDHDDYWPEGRNAGLLAALTADPGADAAYGRIRVLVEPGCDDQGFAALDGTFAPAIGLHVYLFRRAILDRTGPMDESMFLGSDVDYVARLKQAGMRTAIYDGDAAVYRRHSANITLDIAAKREGLFGVITNNIKRRRALDG